MIDPSTALELFKIGAGAVNNFLSNGNVQALATFFGLTGYSLRDLKGLKGLYNFLGLYEKVFPNGLKTEKQETILSDSFIELEDYIKNSVNFDDNVFEKIGALLIHGLENEDLLTREYIRNLKQLTWMELDIFLKVETVKFSYSSSRIDTSEVRENKIDRNIKYEYPIAILLNTFDHLTKIRLIKKQYTGLDKDYFYTYTDLGINIVKLITD